MRISDWSSDVCSSDLAKDRRAGGNDLQAVYRAPSAAAATAALDAFAGRWGERYPTIAPLWRVGWHHLERLLLLPPEVRELVTAFTVLDELNRALRRMLDDRGSRSEEHTSELQSLMRISYAVFCSKKKKNNNNQE